MDRKFFAASAMAGLILAQISTPGASYNGGVPAVPGTRVPESNPATAVPPPQTAAPSAPSAGTGSSFATAPSSNSGPAYSFGAAPPPVVSPAR